MEQFIGLKCYVLKHHTQVIPGFKLQNYAMLRIFRENGRKLVLCNSFLYFVGATDSIINNWTCQRQKTYGFSSTACDQVMEQTYNRDSKVRGGIVGFTLNKNAVHRWIMAQADRGAITRQCFTMTDSSTNSRYFMNFFSDIGFYKT
jgi:hypothetical protein